jgi:hypothetical protein
MRLKCFNILQNGVSKYGVRLTFAGLVLGILEMLDTFLCQSIDLTGWNSTGVGGKQTPQIFAMKEIIGNLVEKWWQKLEQTSLTTGSHHCESIQAQNHENGLFKLVSLGL